MGNHEVLQSLRRQMAHLESGGRERLTAPISSGSPALDALLPNQGLTTGTLVEWVEHGLGSGSGWLAWRTAANALAYGMSPLSQQQLPEQRVPEQQQGSYRPKSSNRLVVIDNEGTFYPAIALAAGIPLSQIVVVRPPSMADAFWAADQALRCPAVTAVWGRFSHLDDRQARRLQLAADMSRMDPLR